RRPLPRWSRQALPAHRQARAGPGASHEGDDDVPRDGHGVLAGAGGGGAEGLVPMMSLASSPHTHREGPMHLVIFILIGLIAGALAGRVVRGHGFGMLGDIVVGIIGAFLGGWIFARFFGVVGGGFIGSLVIAFVGAVILLWLIRLVAPSRV